MAFHQNDYFIFLIDEEDFKRCGTYSNDEQRLKTLKKLKRTLYRKFPIYQGRYDISKVFFPFTNTQTAKL
jgi:hypothetical protein